MEMFNKEKAELEQKNQNNIETIKQKQEQLNDIQTKLDAAIQEIQTLKHDSEFWQKKCKDLQESFNDNNKENQYMRSKLKFFEANNEMIADENIGMPSSSSTMADLEEESFNNDFLANLKSGTDVDDLMSSSELQKRNQSQPAHLRDSYAMRNLDSHMDEKEMRFGCFSGMSSEMPRKKLTRRPSLLPTPTRNPRPSTISTNSASSSSLPSEEKKENAPSRFKNMFSGFSIGKDEVSFKNLCLVVCELLIENVDSRPFQYMLADKVFTMPSTKSHRGRRSSKKFARKKLSKGRFLRKMEEEDSDDINPKGVNCCNNEMKRKEKRRSAQDENRPNLHDEDDDDESSGSISTIIAEEDEEDWLEEEEKISQTSTSKLDKSLEYFKHFEDYQRRTQKMRRRSFNSNRRSSSIKVTTKIKTEVPALMRRTSSNDFEKYQSCLSLRSEGSFVEDLPHNRLKTVKKSFFDSHVAQVSRISDIYVPQKRQRVVESVVKSDSFSWEFNWKDVTKPLPFIVIALLTVAVFCLFSYIYSNNSEAI